MTAMTRWTPRSFGPPAAGRGAIASIAAALALFAAPLAAQGGGETPAVPDSAPAAPQPEPAPNPATVPAARGGAARARHDEINQRVAAAGAGCEIAFVGDSITQGWESAGRAIWAERYAPHTAVNLGIGGDRTEHVLWRFEHGNLDGIAPKVAVVMIGTNNFGHGGFRAEQVLEGVRTVVAVLREKLPTTKVLLLGIFPRGPAFNAMRGQILQVNQALSHLHDGEAVHYLDIGAVFVEPDGSIDQAVMPDFLHLSADGYRRWADAIAPLLGRLLAG